MTFAFRTCMSKLFTSIFTQILREIITRCNIFAQPGHIARIRNGKVRYTSVWDNGNRKQAIIQMHLKSNHYKNTYIHKFCVWVDLGRTYPTITAINTAIKRSRTCNVASKRTISRESVTCHTNRAVESFRTLGMSKLFGNCQLRREHLTGQRKLGNVRMHKFIKRTVKCKYVHICVCMYVYE